MKNNSNGQQVIGGVILIVLAIGLLRSCTDGGFQNRYNSCMAGSYKIAALFKSVFVCLWV